MRWGVESSWRSPPVSSAAEDGASSSDRYYSINVYVIEIDVKASQGKTTIFNVVKWPSSEIVLKHSVRRYSAMRRENWRTIYRLNTFVWHTSCRNCVWYLFYTRFIKIYTCQTQNCAGNKTACTRRHVSTKSAIQTDCKKGNLAKRYNVRTQGPSRGETNAVIHQPYIAIHLP